MSVWKWNKKVGNTDIEMVTTVTFTVDEVDVKVAQDSIRLTVLLTDMDGQQVLLTPKTLYWIAGVVKELENGE